MKKKTSHTKSKKLNKSNKHKNKKLNDVLDVDASDPDVKEIIDLMPAVPEEIIDPKNQKKARGKEKIHYVNSKEFEDEIKKYYNSNNISPKLGESINKIAHGLSYAPNFINYSYKDEMIGDAIVKMVSALKNKKFKINSGFSPFSYFTTIAFHAFINRIKKEKKHHETISSYRDKVYIDTMTSHDADSTYHIYVDPSNNSDDDNYNTAGS